MVEKLPYWKKTFANNCHLYTISSNCASLNIDNGIPFRCLRSPRNGANRKLKPDSTFLSSSSTYTLHKDPELYLPRNKMLFVLAHISTFGCNENLDFNRVTNQPASIPVSQESLLYVRQRQIQKWPRSNSSLNVTYLRRSWALEWELFRLSSRRLSHRDTRVVPPGVRLVTPRNETRHAAPKLVVPVYQNLG